MAKSKDTAKNETRQGSQQDVSKSTVEGLRDVYGNVIRESSIIEIMHQKNIKWDDAVALLRDPK